MFWVTSYFTKAEKASELRTWLLSSEAKDLVAAVERECGARYVDTYWTINSLGESDIEDWWELPNWATFDTLRDSPSFEKLAMRGWQLDFFDTSRPARARMLRSTKDVKTLAPPQKKMP